MKAMRYAADEEALQMNKATSISWPSGKSAGKSALERDWPLNVNVE